MKNWMIPLLIMIMLVTGIFVVAVIGLLWNKNGKMPTQPIAYSHRIHINKVGLTCDTCHQYADRSANAGIPAVEVCVDCHSEVATDKPEIKKLMVYWKNKEPVPWLKVHRQSWHVYFSHKPHIKAGIACNECHGNVEVMATARQVRSLEMGWCVTCHRAKKAATDCLACHK